MLKCLTYVKLRYKEKIYSNFLLINFVLFPVRILNAKNIVVISYKYQIMLKYK